jgi:hypothetical protein
MEYYIRIIITYPKLNNNNTYIRIIITYPKLNNNNILIRGMLYYNTHNDKAPFSQKDLRTTCYH